MEEMPLLGTENKNENLEAQMEAQKLSQSFHELAERLYDLKPSDEALRDELREKVSLTDVIHVEEFLRWVKDRKEEK